MIMGDGDHINNLSVSAYKVPTDLPESDGTLQWDSTTVVLVEISAMGKKGLGYTYGNEAAAIYIDKKLKAVVLGKHPFAIGVIFNDMSEAIRNDGHNGIAYMALSAVDVALWDLKAKIIGLPLCELIGRRCNGARVYGSGGFTSYTDKQLEDQLGDWADKAFPAVKMKIGREPFRDNERIRVARETIGNKTELFVDANGAFSPKQAMKLAFDFQQYNVTWFEEPVSSDNLKGLRFIREHGQPGMKIAAGEYGYNTDYFVRMLEKMSVDVLQADATRCGGLTGFMKAGQISEAFHTPFSFHCAPAIHLHAALCLNPFYIGEYFHDHARIENLFFDGAPLPVNGFLKPDLSRPGLGLIFKTNDADPYRLS